MLWLLLIWLAASSFSEPSVSLVAPWWLARLAFLRLGRPQVVPLERAGFEALAPVQLSPGAGYRDPAARRVDLRSLRVAPYLLDDAFGVRAELDRGIVYVWKRAPLLSCEIGGYARIELSLRDDTLVATARCTLSPLFFLLSGGPCFASALWLALSLASRGGADPSKAVGALFMMATGCLLGWFLVRQSRLVIEPGVEAALAQLFASARGGSTGQAGKALTAPRAAAVNLAMPARRLRVDPGVDAPKLRLRAPSDGPEPAGDEVEAVTTATGRERSK